MKKKFFGLLAVFVSLIMGLISCGGSGDDGPSLEVSPGTMSKIDPIVLAAGELANSLDKNQSKYILLFYVKGTSNYNNRALYMWKEGGDGETASVPLDNKKQDNYNFGYSVMYDGINILSGLPSYIKDEFVNKKDTKIIVKNTGSQWNWQTVDLDLPTSSGLKHYLIISESKTKGESSVYPLPKVMTPSISSATMESSTEMKATISVKLGLEGSANDNGFVLSDSNGKKAVVADVKNYEFKDSNDRSKNFTDTLYIKLADKLDLTGTWYLSKENFGLKVKVNASSALKTEINNVKYDNKDLGLTLNGTKGSFKVFAPAANDVKLLLFNTSANLSTPNDTKQMTGDNATGIWSISDVDVASFKYYKYRITNGTDTNDVCDIYAMAASPDSVAAQITDINTDTDAIPDGWTNAYKNPFGNTGADTKRYTDAVVYEMHIRDWSRLEVADSTGKFLDIANGTKVIEHIKSLGVTHVQILPMFDYAQKNDDKDYNWGYNPYHYNVPEGRYVTDGYTEGTQAVKELRTLIQKFHDAGIAVIMDVVYNHTAGTGKGSLYDMTAPYYYYRLNADGTYSNGSGCGNETDSSAPMFRKYMIESLEHWMKDYHINGFRFDLMGLHEVDTMKAVYEALYKIDKNVMVYGEPWSGGTSPVVDPANKVSIDKCTFSDSVNGVACFNDDFRNGIKGAEYPSFTKGHVSQGGEKPEYSDSDITKGLKGKGFTSYLGRSINYVECHDNLTLADKLALVMCGETKPKIGYWIKKVADDGKLNELKSRDKLAASYMFLSQGLIFINGGQEFLRSKNGDENSYQSDDSVNEIKETFIKKYADVSNYYKGLIKIRKEYPTSFGHCENAKAEKIVAGVTKYEVDDFIVFFNAQDKIFSIPADKQVEGNVVTLDSGSVVVATEKTKPTSVPKLSTLIIKIK